MLKLLIVLFGSILIGLGVPIMISCHLGVDTLSTMIQGIAKHTSLSFGIISILLNIVYLVIVIIMDKTRIGPGTIINMVVIGVTVDLAVPLFPDFSGMSIAARFILMVFGICLIGAGVGIYAATNYGAAPLDALVLILTDKFAKPIAVIRMCFDIGMTTVGFLLGGSVGLGTAVTVFLLGPVMNFVYRNCERIYAKWNL